MIRAGNLESLYNFVFGLRDLEQGLSWIGVLWDAVSVSVVIVR